MKERIRRFIAKGGLILVIAVVAVIGYFLILESANNIFKEDIKEVEIKLNSDGTLSVPLDGDISNLYIFWETDGGTIKPVNAPQDSEDGINDLERQFTDENKWHVAYAHAGEKVIWDSKDADGNDYETATVRATLYAATTDQVVSYIGTDTVEKAMTITLTNKSNLEQSPDRVFSNPIRSDHDSNWNQIYIVEDDVSRNYTLAYRTGNEISENGNLTLCWISDNPVLKETDLMQGGIPKFVGKEMDGINNQTVLSSINMVTCEIAQSTKIEAFMVDINSESYRKNEFKDEDKTCKTEIVLGK